MKYKVLKRILSAAILIVMLVIPASAAFAKTISDPSITPHTKYACLYEATTDTFIYDKGKDEQWIPASMTKVMTAIIVLEENPDLEGILTVPKEALSSFYCSWVDGELALRPGEEISAYELMKYMLLFSANEATTTFAFNICDNYSDFIARMNAKCEELGLENTHFSDSHGLSTSNVTTPSDMIKIAMEAMKYEKFREIVRAEGGELPVSNKRDEAGRYDTLLRLIYPDERYESPYSSYICGVKTGWIEASGYNYVCCMEKDGYVFYSCVMGGEDAEVNGEWAQGDFLDTLSLLKLTDDFEDPSAAIVPFLFAEIFLIFPLIVFVIRKLDKKKNINTI